VNDGDKGIVVDLRAFPRLAVVDYCDLVVAGTRAEIWKAVQSLAVMMDDAPLDTLVTNDDTTDGSVRVMWRRKGGSTRVKCGVVTTDDASLESFVTTDDTPLEASVTNDDTPLESFVTTDGASVDSCVTTDDASLEAFVTTDETRWKSGQASILAVCNRRHGFPYNLSASAHTTTQLAFTVHSSSSTITMPTKGTLTAPASTISYRTKPHAAKREFTARRDEQTIDCCKE
jgi:hypothetical protein